MAFATATLAQTRSAETDYFTRTLTTGQIETAQWAARRIDAADVATLRRRLWNTWKKAAVSVGGEHLPAASVTPDLATPYVGHLTLPDSLETIRRGEERQSAVMPYYWGTKGELVRGANVSVPTFVYIHGSGPRDAEWAASLKWAQAFADAPSRYFIPQIPQEGAYYRWWQRSKQWAWAWLWRQLMLQDGVDADRVYLFGISEGGYGSQRLASFYADYLAAAGPMAGGEPLINAPAENLEHIGFSLLTGAEDRMFFRNRYTAITAEALDSLQRLHPDGYVHRVKLIEGRGHGIDYRPTTPWLLQFRRNAHPRHFTWEDFEMDGEHRRGFYNLRVDQRPGDRRPVGDRRPNDSLRTRYDVNISESGDIDIAVNLVRYVPIDSDATFGFPLTLHWRKELQPATGGAFTLYLDEQLVSLDRPVTVRVNGRKVFSGKLRPNYRHMVESLALFADPQRIYPVGVSVKY